MGNHVTRDKSDLPEPQEEITEIDMKDLTPEHLLPVNPNDGALDPHDKHTEGHVHDSPGTPGWSAEDE